MWERIEPPSKNRVEINPIRSRRNGNKREQNRGLKEEGRLFPFRIKVPTNPPCCRRGKSNRIVNGRSRKLNSEQGKSHDAVIYFSEVPRQNKHSGLLNAIDGVSSSDGRILVMTTNCRDQLDAALIRPGRVDMEVKFTLASKEQIKLIFQHMYAHEGHTNLADMAAEFANQVPDCQYSPANCAVMEAQKQFPMKE